ncbi:MAG: hypothetical protein ACK4TF_08985 [Thermodesulfovibrionales bacterium]
MTLPEIFKKYGVRIACLFGSQTSKKIEFEKDFFEALRDGYFELKGGDL